MQICSQLFALSLRHSSISNKIIIINIRGFCRYHISCLFLVVMVTPTCTLRTISGITCWTGFTLVSTDIGWWRKISAIDSWVARLTIHLTGVNVTITESSSVTSLTFASQVNKFAVSIDRVTFFWLHTLTTVITGTHVNGRTPACACTLVIGSNKS